MCNMFINNGTTRPAVRHLLGNNTYCIIYNEQRLWRVLNEKFHIETIILIAL
jgi:hypothetical protein